MITILAKIILVLACALFGGVANSLHRDGEKGASVAFCAGVAIFIGLVGAFL